MYICTIRFAKMMLITIQEYLLAAVQHISTNILGNSCNSWRTVCKTSHTCLTRLHTKWLIISFGPLKLAFSWIHFCTDKKVQKWVCYDYQLYYFYYFHVWTWKWFSSQTSVISKAVVHILYVFPWINYFNVYTMLRSWKWPVTITGGEFSEKVGLFCI